jgi:Mg-chelatase subunit ChlD
MIKKGAIPNSNKKVERASKGREIEGSMKTDEQGLAHSIVEGNKDRMQQGMLLESSINQGLFAFNADMMFEHIVKDYRQAEKLYGETLLRFVTGYSSNAIKKNINLPEFQRELKQKIKNKIDELKEEEFLGDENEITDKGFTLASLTMYMKELDDLTAKGLGEKKQKQVMVYGDKENTRTYKHGDRFHDIALKKSIKLAIRRSHKALETSDLQVYEKDSKGKIYIIYGLDSSGSMKGKKLEAAKKAGIALAFKAMDEKDKVGLLVFGEKIEQALEPTTDFSLFIKSLVRVRAHKQTNIALTIEKAIEMFPAMNVTKHLVLLTDAIPTAGEKPLEDTLILVEKAFALGITISVIGIDIDKEGSKLAKRIVELSNGRLYVIKDLENLDRIILQDYYGL